MADEELEEIRQRKLMQLRQQLAEAQREEEVERQIVAQREAVLRRILTPDARSRLTNLKMVKSQFATQIENQLIQLAQTGRINSPLTDNQLKEILKKMQSQRRETKIRFR